MNIPFEDQLQLFHQASRIPLCIYDSARKTMFHYPFISAPGCSPQTMQQCYEVLKKSPVKQRIPLLYSAASCFFALLQLEEHTSIMFGPVSSVPLTYREFYYINQNSCNPEDLLYFYRVMQQSPRFTLSQFAWSLSLFVQLLFHKTLSVETILAHQVCFQKSPELLLEDTGNPLHDEPHYMSITEAIEFQKHILLLIQNGNVTEIEKNFQQTPFFTNLETSPSSVKELQKIFFVYATLCCITVLEEKLELPKAYSIFDAYTAKIPSIATPEDLSALCKQISIDYSVQMFTFKKKQSVSPVVTKCLQYIQENLYSRITVDDLAHHCNLSKRSITRHFTEFYHISAADYILDCKLEESAFLLTHSAFSLAEISSQLAFSSQSHFTSAFKKKYSCTPQKYRDTTVRKEK